MLYLYRSPSVPDAHTGLVLLQGGIISRTPVFFSRRRLHRAVLLGVTYPGTGALDALLDFDQLTLARSRGAAFGGFSEARVTFEPTYKYDKVGKRKGKVHRKRNRHGGSIVSTSPPKSKTVLFKTLFFLRVFNFFRLFFLSRAPNGSTLRAKCAPPRGQIASCTPPRGRTRCHLSSTRACLTLATATTGPCTLSSGSSWPTDWSAFFLGEFAINCTLVSSVFRCAQSAVRCCVFAEVAETVDWFKYRVERTNHRWRFQLRVHFF